MHLNTTLNKTVETLSSMVVALMAMLAFIVVVAAAAMLTFIIARDSITAPERNVFIELNQVAGANIKDDSKFEERTLGVDLPSNLVYTINA